MMATEAAEVRRGRGLPAGLMPEHTSTFGLVERFRKGDEEAFAALFAKYKPRLAVFIHYRLRPDVRTRVDVDDVLQEVFFAAAKDISGFAYRGPGSFFAWLVKIAEHALIDTARYEARQKRQAAEMLRFRSASNPEGPDPAISETPSRIYARDENMRLLLERLDRLTEDDRGVILMAKFEGLSTAEIAERLGKTRAGVALQLHRALERFRRLDERGKQG